MKVDVVLLEPLTAGNVGAVARVMKNFGFDNLVLIEPKCNHLDEEGVARAMHAKDVLKNAEVIDREALLDYDVLVATTAMIGTDFNINRSPIHPEKLGERLSSLADCRVGLLFGREDIGLSNEEIEECDFSVSIPTSPDYPTMNLSHSVAILLYEVHKASEREGIGEDIKPIGVEEKRVLLSKIDSVLDDIDFQTEQKKETQKLLWKRIIGKSMLTNREAYALMGLFKKFDK